MGDYRPSPAECKGKIRLNTGNSSGNSESPNPEGFFISLGVLAVQHFCFLSPRQDVAAQFV
jgi:hypothetical protein